MRRVQRSDWFVADLEHYAAWYVEKAAWEVAEQYLSSVSATISRLAKMPGIGRPTFFSAPELRGLRSHAAEPPFQKHLIFCRDEESVLYLERIIHGARNLPRILTEPPDLD